MKSTTILDIALALLIPSLVLVHLIVAPYTKVEESFNIQATHDVLVYGTPTSNIYERLSSTYDHFTFPGAVPRTFLGPVLLAGITQPIIGLVGFQHAQFIVRAALGLANAASLLFFAYNLARAYGRATARWFILLQASQFHIIFYASRTLPNMYAMILTTLAFSFLVPHPNPKLAMPRQRLAISMFVFSAIIFRSEIALLLGTNVLYLLLTRAMTVERIILPFSVSVVVALILSVPVDSYFWQKPLWPELWGFYYNVVLGSSSNWGTSPWYYYFASALPRLLVNPLAWIVLIPLSLTQPALSPSARRLVIPSLLFVAIYSIQPHKEARFIFYVVPPLTAAAALGANFVFTRRSKSVVAGFFVLVMAVSVLLSFAASTSMLLLSSLNYPGGEALAYLRDTVIRSGASEAASPSAVVPIHADVLACMTGVTLFGTATGSAFPSSRASTATLGQFVNTAVREDQEDAAGAVELVVDKTEDDATLVQEDFWTRFDYVLTEEPAKVKKGPTSGWEVVAIVQGYGGVEVQMGRRQTDEERAEEETPATKAPIVGRGAVVAKLKDRVSALTGGRWIGPRMVPRIYILKRVKNSRVAVDA